MRAPRAPRAWAIVLAGLALFMAGCGTATACPATNAHVRADSGGTEDIHVTLDDGTPAVLHLGNAKIYRASGGQCTPSTSSAIFIGSELDIHVFAWAESYPLQGSPDVVILH